MKNFLKFLVTGLFLLLLTAQFVYAAPARVVFLTEPLRVEPGELSEMLTIQTQTDDGEPVKVDETFDLEFVSTSATGEFLNSEGEPVSLVMSRNSSNRNFYYRDSTAGNVTLVVTLTGRTSGLVLETSQAIGVGQAPAATDESAGGGETTSVSSRSLSSHTSPPELSKLTEKHDFKIGAGRARLAMVNSPVWFRATIESPPGRKPEIIWSFGDGFGSRGESVAHTYRAPGNYTVVARGRLGDDEVSSRTTVEVVAPEVRVVTDGQGELFLENRGTQELNLGGWRLLVDDKELLLALETILPGRGKLPLGPLVGQPGERVVVLDRKRQVLGGWTAVQPPSLARAEIIPPASVPALPVRAPILSEPIPTLMATSTNVAAAALIEIPAPLPWWGRGVVFLRNLFGPEK